MEKVRATLTIYLCAKAVLFPEPHYVLPSTSTHTHTASEGFVLAHYEHTHLRRPLWLTITQWHTHTHCWSEVEWHWGLQGVFAYTAIHRVSLWSTHTGIFVVMSPAKGALGETLWQAQHLPMCVFVHMCVCVHVCAHVCMCVYVHACVCVHSGHLEVWYCISMLNKC